MTLPDSGVRDAPVLGYDPTATYDVQNRKQPKRLGFMEYARALPWLVTLFPREVPQELVSITDDQQAVFDCVCGEIVYAAHNRHTDCPGICGRTFVSIGNRVLVHRECPQAIRSVGDRVVLRPGNR